VPTLIYLAQFKGEEVLSYNIKDVHVVEKPKEKTLT